MDKKQISLTERVPFLIGITLLGGFLDTYTYVTRDGMLCTMHTGNMAKLGISLAEGNWAKALSFFIPIVACVLGSITVEAVKHHTTKEKDWRKPALLLEIIALILVGFVPMGVASVFVTTAISYISGIQMCIFRTTPWGGHNTTFCTGNLRTLGQFLYAAFTDRTSQSRKRVAFYACIAFSFTAGAAIGIPICSLIGSMSSSVGAAIAAILLFAMVINDKKTSPAL